MNRTNNRPPVSRRTFLAAAATAAGGLALAACGQAAGGAGADAQASAATASGAGAATTGSAAGTSAGRDAAITWSTWGNPGELGRFQEYTADFNQRVGASAELVAVPNAEYQAKLLTQLAGDTAPDVFYAYEPMTGQLIKNAQIVELTDLLSGPESKSKPEDFFDGMWGIGKTKDDKIWAVPPDANPLVIWYNTKVLEDAGVTTLPVELYQQGQWNWQAFQQMCEQVVASNKRGFVFENWWAPTYSWITTNGGQVYDFTNGTWIVDQDPKAVEAFKFLQDNLNSKNFTYSGSLPKGQGVDAMFMSQQAAFIGAGRWLLPVFSKNAALTYDVVPYPTNTGNKIEPAGIASAYMVINSKAADPEAAFAFLTDFVSTEGQIFRLKGGGNAIPAVKGADEVVAEGNNPANWQAFIDAREVGYTQWPEEAAIPGVNDDIVKALDELWLQGGELESTLQKIAGQVEQKQKAVQSGS